MNGRVIIQRLISARCLPVLAAMALLVVAALLKPITLNRPVYSLQLVYDISQSMNVTDVSLKGEKITRLAWAKQITRDTLRALPCGSEVGLSIFTGKRTLTLLTPLAVCEHYAGLLATLDEIHGQMRWSNGSIIGKGLHQAIRGADSYDSPTAVIFFTDGHEAPPMEPGQRGMPRTDRFDVDGILAGIGSTTPSPIPKTDAEGRVIGFWQPDDVVQRQRLESGVSREELSYRHDDHMEHLAKLSGFAYTPLDKSETLMQTLNSDRFATQQPTPTDIRWIPLLLALTLLLWRFLPSWIDARQFFRASSRQPG